GVGVGGRTRRARPCGPRAPRARTRGRPEKGRADPRRGHRRRRRGEAAGVGEWLSRSAVTHEIVVVDDGSCDDTAARARAAGGEGLVLLRHEPNRGKGYAVRRGMLAARGGRRLMTDADLS